MSSCDNYFEVTSSLLICDEKCGFDLFLKADESFVLFVFKGTPVLPEHIKKVYTEDIDSLYVKNSEVDGYREYICKNLSKVVTDENTQLDKKAKVIYDSSQVVMAKLFKHPETQESLSAVKDLSDTILHMLINDSGAFASLVKISSNSYSTYTHCINVMVYALALGKSIGLCGKDLEALGYGAALHDVGKSKIPSRILDKNDKLSDSEFEIIKLHPTKGLNILEILSENDSRILDAVYYHHEKLDGSGYPRGLFGDIVPLSARIVAISDIFDALNSEKTYKPSMSSFDTLQYMKTSMSKQLDLKLLKNFILCLSGR